MKEGEVYATCDPTYADQLLGGWMKASKGGKDRTIKRRSPLSISSMRGLHPFLAGVDSENISFDRSDRPNNAVIIRNEKGDQLTEDQISDLLLEKDRSLSRKWIPALAYAIINWTITSNQSRTFSLMETLAVSISDNANKIAGSIRAKLKEEEENKAEHIIEENIQGVDSYVTLSAGGYVRTKKESADALDRAEQKLIDLMLEFDFENQLVEV